MKRSKWFDKLHKEGLVSDDSYQKIINARKSQTVSVYWELSTMLYLGVLLLSSGIGILIYKNIESIGHSTMLIIIAVLCVACFVYCFAKGKHFSTQKVESPGLFFDYILLLGCLLFISLIAYLQYQYNSFGNRYGLASFIPLCVLFFSAYYFDHLGVLSLGITNFAAWLGITITPMQIIRSNHFENGRLILTGLLIAIVLLVMGFISRRRDIKAHFAFTYKNFGIHLLFIAAIAAMMRYEVIELLIFIGFVAIAIFYAWLSMKQKSFYFLVISTLYGYIGLSYIVVKLLSVGNMGLAPVYLMVFYFIISGIGLARFLMYCNRKLKTDDRV